LESTTRALRRRSRNLKGPCIYLAEGNAPPVEVLPPPSPRKNWTRRGIAGWQVERLAEDALTLAGIDHGFSLPRPPPASIRTSGKT